MSIKTIIYDVIGFVFISIVIFVTVFISMAILSFNDAFAGVIGMHFGIYSPFDLNFIKYLFIVSMLCSLVGMYFLKRDEADEKKAESQKTEIPQ